MRLRSGNLKKPFVEVREVPPYVSDVDSEFNEAESTENRENASETQENLNIGEILEDQKMPNFIKTQKDEEDWKRAKSIVKKGYPGIDEKSEKFWKLVNHIYFSISKKRKNNPLVESLMND